MTGRVWGLSRPKLGVLLVLSAVTGTGRVALAAGALHFGDRRLRAHLAVWSAGSVCSRGSSLWASSLWPPVAAGIGQAQLVQSSVSQPQTLGTSGWGELGGGGGVGAALSRNQARSRGS